MNEAARCDRISLMDAGRVLATDTPAGLVAARGAATLEDAFIGYLEEADGSRPICADAGKRHRADPPTGGAAPTRQLVQPAAAARLYDPRIARAAARSDPARLRAARHGLPDAGLRLRHLDRRQQSVLRRARPRPDATRAAPISRSCAARAYFVEKPPLADYADLEKRLKSGEVTAAIEIPPGFGRDIKRGRPV